MRQFELSTDIPAGQERSWRTLVRLDEWSAWNQLVPQAKGDLRPGSILDLKIRGRSGRLSSFRPVVVSLAPPGELVLEASVGRRWLLHMVHTFSVERMAPEASRLRQHWVATGLLAPMLWPVIRNGMARFAQLGSDLALRTAQTGPEGAAQPSVAADGASPRR